uniref:Uncharacterized protein n=1 Tax=Oryza meridionalis TaxID=40149 RepID=A0A0E0FA91_9ORYZ
MSPNACRLRHTFCVELTPMPMLMPVRLPWIPPLAANSELITSAPPATFPPPLGSSSCGSPSPAWLELKTMEQSNGKEPRTQH